MDPKTILAECLTKLTTSDDSSSSPLDITPHLLPFIKIVRNAPVKRGDATVSLLPLTKLFSIPLSVRQNLEQLLSDSKSDTSAQILERLQLLLAAEQFSTSSILVSHNTLILCFSRTPVIQATLDTVLQSSQPEHLYGSNESLKDVCLNIYAPLQHSSQCLTSHRCVVTSKHVSALLRLSGGTCTVGDDVTQSNDHKQATDETKCEAENDTENTMPEESESAVFNSLIFTSRTDDNCLRGMISVSPVIDKKDRKKIRNLNFGDVIRKCSLLRILDNELQTASEHRETAVTDSSAIRQQAEDCLTLVLLAGATQTPIVFTSTENGENTRGPAFLLYNYSRVSSILLTFHDMVRVGGIAKMEEKELSPYLKEEEEWELIWCFINVWPLLVKEVSDNVIASARCRHTNKKPIQVHLVVKFLQEFCRCFSRYYNRVRVLPNVDNTSVLPLAVQQTFHARIRLLKAVQVTMKSAFHTLGIVPPTVM